MSEHIGFNDERAVERGRELTPEQKKHLKKCIACKIRLGAVVPSRWQQFLDGLKAVFSRKKSP